MRVPVGMRVRPLQMLVCLRVGVRVLIAQRREGRTWARADGRVLVRVQVRGHGNEQRGRRAG